MIGKLRALSVLVSRANLASRAGMTFANERDLYSVLGYKSTLAPADYRARFDRNGIAARVVTALPKATWRNGANLVEDEDPETTTEFEKAWEEFETRLNVWSTFLRADILAGLGRYAVVLIGAPGDFEDPIEDLRSPDEILYLSPFGEEDATIDTIDEDETSERFGLPLMYKFSRIVTGTTPGGQGTKSTGSRRVHWSRVLHVADGVLDEQIFGTPRMQNVWNFLDDLEKIVGGGSEAFWLRVNQGTQFNLDKDVELNDDELTDFRDQIDDFAHGIRRYIRTRGLDVNVLGSDVSDFNNPLDAILTLIAGSTGIPKRILVGSEMGHLASTQDRNNWHERVEDRRTEFADPWVIRPFVDWLIQLGGLPDPPNGYYVSWPHITKMDEKQRADVADKLSKVNKQIGDTIITAQEIRDSVLQLPPLDEVIDLDDETEITEEAQVPAVAQRKKFLQRSRTLIKPRKLNLGSTSMKRQTKIKTGLFGRLRKQ